LHKPRHASGSETISVSGSDPDSDPNHDLDFDLDHDLDPDWDPGAVKFLSAEFPDSSKLSTLSNLTGNSKSSRKTKH